MTIDSEHLDNSMTAIVDDWEIQFSRFFNNPSLSSTSSSSTSHPELIRKSKNSCRGIWISSSSASLQLLTDHFTPQAILVVRSGGRIHVSCSFFVYNLSLTDIVRLHFISSLNFFSVSALNLGKCASKKLSKWELHHVYTSNEIRAE